LAKADIFPFIPGEIKAVATSPLRLRRGVRGQAAQLHVNSLRSHPPYPPSEEGGKARARSGEAQGKFKVRVHEGGRHPVEFGIADTASRRFFTPAGDNAADRSGNALCFFVVEIEVSGNTQCELE
jgi:hypothetical protein